MADVTIVYNEQMVGSGHPTKADTLNRLALIEHNTDGTHKYGITGLPHVDVREFLPSGFVTTGLTDYTTEVQAANDSIDTTGGNLVFPIGTWTFNLTASNGVNIEGQSIKSTIFKPATDEAVIKTKLTDNTNNIVYKNFQIVGDVTMTTQQDGIRLKATTAGKSITNVILESILIKSCGRYGLTTYGTSTSGPFVQQLTGKNLQISDCIRSGLYVDGLMLETLFENCFIYRNGDATYPNIDCAYNTGAINRMKWVGGGVNHSSYPTTGIAARFAHSIGVSFDNVDFEAADKFLQFTGNQTRQITLIGNNFASNTNVTTAVEIQDANGVVIENNGFTVTGATMTNAIYDTDLGVGRVVNVRVGKNRYGSNVTNTVKLYNLINIASGIIYAYKDILRVDTEASASTDDLDYIYDNTGTASVTELQDGEMLTIRAFNAARDVVVKHNVGNIMLKASVDTTLADTHVTITLRWDRTLAKWLEI